MGSTARQCFSITTFVKAAIDDDEDIQFNVGFPVFAILAITLIVIEKKIFTLIVHSSPINHYLSTGIAVNAHK